MFKHIIRILFLVFLFSGSSMVFAQSAGQKITYSQYIETYKDIAIRKMNEYRIPASITLAQGLLESGSGNSELAKNANNHFGIKCHKEWSGMTYTMDDDEKNECFRKYATAEESYSDHSYFLTSRARYATLFELDVKDYKGWAYGLKSAGYATNPKYAEMLIRIIEENQLFLYDTGFTGSIAGKKEPEKKQPKETKAISRQEKSGSFKFLEVAEGNRKLYLNNNVKLTYARPDDTPQTIARDLGIHAFQILQYNEMGKNEQLQPGQVVYVEPKKKKASVRNHTFKAGESMREVSQLYGVKLKSLYRMNGLPEGHEPEPGTNVELQKRRR